MEEGTEGLGSVEVSRHNFISCLGYYGEGRCSQPNRLVSQASTQVCCLYALSRAHLHSVLISHFRLKPRHAAVQYVPRSMSDSEIQSVLKGAELQDFLDKVRHRYICMDN